MAFIPLFPLFRILLAVFGCVFHTVWSSDILLRLVLASILYQLVIGSKSNKLVAGLLTSKGANLVPVGCQVSLYYRKSKDTGLLYE